MLGHVKQNDIDDHGETEDEMEFLVPRMANQRNGIRKQDEMIGKGMDSLCETRRNQTAQNEMKVNEGEHEDEGPASCSRRGPGADQSRYLFPGGVGVGPYTLLVPLHEVKIETKKTGVTRTLHAHTHTRCTNLHDIPMSLNPFNSLPCWTRAS